MSDRKVRFKVSRTSVWQSDTQPCEGAVRDGRDWFIVAEIWEFVEKHGTCVISTHASGPEVEIYDERRE